uniref:Uncharacterized protein n=1 Tax=Fundulus heteroclitus TaxID=8078 RepID=A0A3Q2PG85_FUNHE
MLGPGDEGALLHLCLHSQMSKQRHLVADRSTTRPNENNTALFLLYPPLSSTFPLCLSAGLSLREEEDDDIAHQFCCPASECSSPSSR